VRAQGAPGLAIVRFAKNSVINSCPPASTGWALCQDTNLNTVNWSEVLKNPNDDGTTKRATVVPPVGNRFYRLKKPWGIDSSQPRGVRALCSKPDAESA
jgi:hypothetical protein